MLYWVGYIFILVIERSREITSKVTNLFEDQGVPVLDVAELVENEPVRQLIVNSLDAHPSKWVHQQVADKLHEMILQLE